MFVPANIIVRCYITNVGSKPLKELRSETLTEDGSLAASGGDTDLAPGHSNHSTMYGGIDRMLRCHWSFKGAARKARGAICVDLLGCLPAS